MEAYLAHSARNEYKAQSYKDHVVNTTKLALHFAQEIKEYCSKDADLLAEVLRLAAEYHDLGKLDRQNQAVLRREGKKLDALPINHVDAGAAFLKQKNKEISLSLKLIYAHHRGLPDIPDEKARGEKLCYREDHIPVRNYVDQELEQLLQLHRGLVPEAAFPNQEKDANRLQAVAKGEGDQSVLLRMLLSCLADADHSDTAAVYGRRLELEAMPRLQPALRLAALERYVASLQGGAQNRRNELRMQMYMECRDCDCKAGMASHDGTVGSGKTTAVMAHQLQQAIIRGARHIFVVLPFTNIITQAVEVYRKALVLPGEDPELVVAEMHYKADFENADTRYLTTLWRAPIIVTTAVSFFETLASNRPGTLRRLHELPGSIIFVDEAHAALPLKLLPLAWHWMKKLEAEWSCYWILASGSLVRFWQIPKLIENEARQVPDIVRPALREALLSYEKNRIQFCWQQRPQSRTELVDWVMAEQGPRLVIMNTVKSAAVIADDICKKYGRGCVEHLSTALIAGDRTETVQIVKKRLANEMDKNWVLVATSCVEAGVDFSFRTGFREMSSVLSLLQSAGRVDRNGIYEDTKMWSFCMQDDPMLESLPKVKECAELLEEYFEEEIAITPELSTISIQDELSRDSSGVKEMRALMKAELDSKFTTVNDKFQVIESDVVPVIVNSAIAEKIKLGYGKWQDVQKYAVSISKRKLKKWEVGEITEGLYQWTLPYDSFLGYMAGVLNEG